MANFRTIEKGDIVMVNFNTAGFTLTPKAFVRHIPCDVGDSWEFEDCNTGQVHRVSEGCTVTRLLDAT